VQAKYSTAIFSEVGLHKDWFPHLYEYFSCLLTVVPVYQYIPANSVQPKWRGSNGN